jgi:hypothetical protein
VGHALIQTITRAARVNSRCSSRVNRYFKNKKKRIHNGRHRPM